MPPLSSTLRMATNKRFIFALIVLVLLLSVQFVSFWINPPPQGETVTFDDSSKKTQERTTKDRHQRRQQRGNFLKDLNKKKKNDDNNNNSNSNNDKKDEELMFPPTLSTNNTTNREDYYATFLFSPFNGREENAKKDGKEDEQAKMDSNSPLSKSLRLVHVWSPYVVPDKNNIFAPLDQAQNITWESMYRAHQYVQNFMARPYNNKKTTATNNNTNNDDDTSLATLTVDIYCAILWMDVEILQAQQPPLCRPDNTIVLRRSTVTSKMTAEKKETEKTILDDEDTEKNQTENEIHFPFVQDMLDPLWLKADGEKDGSSDGNNTNDDSSSSLLVVVSHDYVILTNSDISVVEPFYVLSAMTIRKYGYDAFTVNRRTISKGYNPSSTAAAVSSLSLPPNSSLSYGAYPYQTNNNNNHDDDDNTASSTIVPWTSHDIPKLESTELLHYTQHPGTDCYVVRSEVLQSIHLGNLFLGHPPWAKVLKYVLWYHMADSYRILPSKFGWTYHLGDDRKWDKNGGNGDLDDGNDDDDDDFIDGARTGGSTASSNTGGGTAGDAKFVAIPGWTVQQQQKAATGCAFRNHLAFPSANVWRNTKSCSDLSEGMQGVKAALRNIMAAARKSMDDTDINHSNNAPNTATTTNTTTKTTMTTTPSITSNWTTCPNVSYVEGILQSLPIIPSFALDRERFQRVTSRRFVKRCNQILEQENDPILDKIRRHAARRKEPLIIGKPSSPSSSSTTRTAANRDGNSSVYFQGQGNQP